MRTRQIIEKKLSTDIINGKITLPELAQALGCRNDFSVIVTAYMTARGL